MSRTGSPSRIQEWFNIYTQCQDALNGGDSLEIESAKVAYQKLEEEVGSPPIDRADFGIFPDSTPVGTGTKPTQATDTGPRSVGDLLGSTEGVFGLLYRILRQERSQGTSSHPPQGVSGTYR